MDEFYNKNNNKRRDAQYVMRLKVSKNKGKTNKKNYEKRIQIESVFNQKV